MGRQFGFLMAFWFCRPFFKKQMKYYSSFFATGVHKVKFKVQVLGLVYFRKYTKRKGYWINELGIKVSDRKQKRIDQILWNSYKDTPFLRKLGNYEGIPKTIF